jgi:hypothetical protein
MPEAFSWMEGSAVLYPIGLTAVAAYAQDTNAVLTWGWNNRRLVTGAYIDVFTGQRADVTIGAAYAPNAGIVSAANVTALSNLHLSHVHAGGSAGLWLYSGQIDRLELIGSENYPYVYRISYHANIWSAY